jgi:hypothetical protein
MIRAPSLKVGHANFTTVEDIPSSEEVLASTFFLFEHPIIILFDSRASQGFISLACAQRAKVTPWAMKALYSICTSGGRIVADRMVHLIPLELAG